MESVFRVCCGPCDIQSMCCEEHSCCIDCHCTFEEQVALPYLPREIAQRIVSEHQRMQAQGWPSEQLIAHSKWEDQWFRRYCPPEVIAQIDHDHRAYERGLLAPQPQMAMGATPVDVGAARDVITRKKPIRRKKRSRRTKQSATPFSKLFGF